MPLNIRELSSDWFDRPQYRPRVSRGSGDSWFLLTPEFAPPSQVDPGPPREPPAGREALRLAFEETYEAWSLPRCAATDRSLDSLEREGTGLIIAGQQPGFLGGPLHTLYKAITAIALARQQQAKTGRACVPVFWVAGDDHDLEEVRAARLPGPDGKEVSFRFPGESDRRPLAEYRVDGAAIEVLEAAARHLGAKRHGETAQALLKLYHNRNLASGFAALLTELLGHTGMLVLDPVSIRPMASTLIRRVIEEPERIVALIEEGRKEVAAQGMKPLVGGRLPLFLLRQGRRDHLSPADGGLEVDGGGPILSQRELLETLEKDPRAFSPGALLRPLVQESCLPCLITVGGPAEVGYFAQIGPLAAHFGLQRPAIALRFNSTLVEGKMARTASSLPLETIARARRAEDLLSPQEEPVQLQAARELAARVERELTALVRDHAPPEQAERMRKKAKDASNSVLRLTDRLATALLQRRTQEVEEARKLWSFAFPGDVLQERRWNMLHFISKHGTAWIDEIIESVADDPLGIAHRWVLFGES